MVVKSATKKRLLDLGLSEDLAHKLATDRKMGEVRMMNINQLEKITESQFSAMATKLRITFDKVIHEFFTSSTKSKMRGDTPYRSLVAVANPRSSLEYRSKKLKSCIINWWTDYAVDNAHDFDQVMAKFRRGFPKSWVEMVGQVNDDWYPEYYEDWVSRNSPNYRTREVFEK